MGKVNSPFTFAYILKLILVVVFGAYIDKFDFLNQICSKSVFPE